MTQSYCILGNPNVGKTSLFNALTGSYEYIGNWSGVTVEKKVGKLKDNVGDLVDLPGIYDLSPISKDETVVTDYLMSTSFTGMINIIDACQLKRNLNLTIQLMELNKPMIIGLNMIDVATQRGIKINYQALMRKLKVPVFPIVARKAKGTHSLLGELNYLEPHQRRAFKINYGTEIETAIQQICSIIKQDNMYPTERLRFIAIQYLIDNVQIYQELDAMILEQLEPIKRKLSNATEQSTRQRIEAVRNDYINQLLEDIVEYPEEDKQFFISKVDRLLLNRYLGIPIFLGIMWLIFQTTFTWIGTPLSDQLDAFISGPLSEWIKSVMNTLHITSFLQDLITDGIIAGVGSVLVFVPQIVVLFFFISLLEDSGYMARIAVLMDKTMESIGLSGKSFIPMIIGFGCNVPSIMAARSIENEKERLITILVAPFMSCSARLPVYALFVGAFFSAHQSLVVLSLYILGIVVALLVSTLLNKLILKDNQSVFIVELPTYRVPSFKTLWRSTWEKAKGFVKKAGTFIFGGSVVIWTLTYIGPHGVNVPINQSFMHMIGQGFANLIAPLGFGSWQAGATLIPGFLAKEVIISSMAILYSSSESGLTQVIQQQFTPLSAYAFMIFILLYVPCISTVATIRKETSSWKWTLLAVVYPIATAYILTFVFYQVSQLFI
ncbi:ferrous iron transport protein B [Staphylococcus epidermidis]|uniref:ferrous iron transport protein B n=1 Tax=Staphylococcus epidermidis TaxID=1282 RepID=UPI0001AB1BEE|nr:ferrous iron transport protein B [Staphylococcus epidermidis]EES57350.1 ferrous iron transport protein B [Staphylococcus epidermidis BCM-HMP0060]MDH8967804.1 ferrous iron transport protein B [Staphylococcus epidermidis]MDH9052349.1 ferrous iron transport protein B [Staphylococcus epidermidis]MDH9542204.1 ferrous iron transport protein B [Staphylococcus epidermidis]MDH9555860.1 ferrous iron transport protein B [Staphylococcus epidermidis]